MKEEFIGTAILDRSLRPQQLYLIGRLANGNLFRNDGLPVYPAGSPKPSECAWVYEVHGNTLHVRPSVRIRLRAGNAPDYFHNEGFWIIRFEDGRKELLEEVNKAILPQYAPHQVGAGIYEWGQITRDTLRLTDLEPSFIKIKSLEPYVYTMDVPFQEAQGMQFLCPKCFLKNKGSVGTHSVMCWFQNRGVPDSLDPKPGRWNPNGPSFESMTFLGPGSTSVLITDHAHFHIAGGKVMLCDDTP